MRLKQRTKSIKVFIALVVFAVSFAVSSFGVMAANSYIIPHATTVSVDELSLCQQVTNNHPSGKSVVVPTKTVAEWLSFRTNLPTGVTLGACDIVVTLSNATNVNIQSLFSAGDWSGPLIKRVIIPAGVVIGGTSSGTPALRTGTGWGGSLVIENAGSIQGAGGQPNSGAGGTAFLADAAGVQFTNTGTIYGGGGAGGIGGAGGQGYYYYYAREPASGDLFSAYGYDWEDHGGSGYVHFWWAHSSGPPEFQGNASTQVQIGSWMYYRGAFRYTASGYYNHYGMYRQSVNASTAYTSGGAGGNGGRGQGYDGSNLVGSGGAGGGTNAGTGGTGGAGGGWGSNGAGGATGTTGNYTGGLGGGGGGSAGHGIQNDGYVTLTNSGTILGL